VELTELILRRNKSKLKTIPFVKRIENDVQDDVMQVAKWYKVARKFKWPSSNRSSKCYFLVFGDHEITVNLKLLTWTKPPCQFLYVVRRFCVISNCISSYNLYQIGIIASFVLPQNGAATERLDMQYCTVNML